MIGPSHYLLDINLDDLDQSTGEDQAIWLLALKAARKALQLRENHTNGTATVEDRAALLRSCKTR